MKGKSRRIISHIILIILGLGLIYPLIWLILSTFKENQDLFISIKLLPENWIFDAYIKGWAGVSKGAQFTFLTFFENSFMLVIPTVVFTIVSSTIVAYGFTRFDFPLKKLFFSLMISTLLLPNAVIVVPRYIIFRNLKWLDSYLPFYVPAMLATSAFFVFLMVQFLRGIPKELDESAKIDGCNSLQILISIILPLAKPALFSIGIFQFMWTWNDFFNSMIYINSVSKFTVALGLRLAIDNASDTQWNQVLAMSLVSIIPCIALFAFAQKYFVEGIAT